MPPADITERPESDTSPALRSLHQSFDRWSSNQARQSAGPSTSYDPRRESLPRSPTTISLSRQTNPDYQATTGADRHEHDLQRRREELRAHFAEEAELAKLDERRRLANGGAEVIADTQAYHRRRAISAERRSRQQSVFQPTPVAPTRSSLVQQQPLFPGEDSLNEEGESSFSRGRREQRAAASDSQQSPQMNLPRGLEIQTQLGSRRQISQGPRCSLPGPSESSSQQVSSQQATGAPQTGLSPLLIHRLSLRPADPATELIQERRTSSAGPPSERQRQDSMQQRFQNFRRDGKPRPASEDPELRRGLEDEVE